MALAGLWLVRVWPDHTWPQGKGSLWLGAAITPTSCVDAGVWGSAAAADCAKGTLKTTLNRVAAASTNRPAPRCRDLPARESLPFMGGGLSLR
ncbi:hypothetical protein Pen01_41540 [Phytomonospora endophytica]|nr:hypothetical protein Pen01_41540 [Phytomonospora endophytica]